MLVAILFFILFRDALCAPIDDYSNNQNINSSSVSSLISEKLTSREKTLLITQKWLIDNINLLRREMNELARDYNQHVDSSKAEEVRKEVEFVRDVSSLRSDHTILQQTLQQLIDIVKNSHNQLLPFNRSNPSGINLKLIDDNNNNLSNQLDSQSTRTLSSHSRHHRHIKSDYHHLRKKSRHRLLAPNYQIVISQELPEL